MKTILHSAAAFVFTFLVGLSLQAETLTGISMIEEYALSNNIEYKSAILNTVKAYNDLEYFFTIDESNLSLSGSYSSEKQSPNFQAAASLPLFKQLSLNTSVNQDLEGSIGFKLSPLTHSDSIEQTRLNYTLALASAESAAEEVKLASVEDYLKWSAAVKEKEIAGKLVDIKKIIYEDEKIRMENGEAVLDDVRETFIKWSAARTTYNNAVTSFQQAETQLYSTLNADSETTFILPAVTEDILPFIEELSSSINIDILTIAESLEVLSSQIETESLEAEMVSTWFFQPSLDIVGAVNFTSGLTPEFSATIAVTAGLDDFKSTDIDELQTELNLSREKENRTAADQKLLLNQRVTAAETANLNFEKAGVELEQASELYQEAEYLFGLGKYSAAELEETRLLLETSKNSLFSAAAGEFTSLRTLITYSP
jgi:outer membrane protein TolC